jgi:hypothetical protein
VLSGRQYTENIYLYFYIIYGLFEDARHRMAGQVNDELKGVWKAAVLA